METTTIGAAARFVWRWSNSRKRRRNTRYRLETDCCSRGIVNFAGEGYSIRAQEFTSRMGNQCCGPNGKYRAKLEEYDPRIFEPIPWEIQEHWRTKIDLRQRTRTHNSYFVSAA